MTRHFLPLILAELLAVCSMTQATTPIAITRVTDDYTVRALVD